MASAANSIMNFKKPTALAKDDAVANEMDLYVHRLDMAIRSGRRVGDDQKFLDMLKAKAKAVKAAS